MKLVITGGFGFIGSHFVEYALEHGHEILVLDKMTYAANLLNLSEGIRRQIAFSEVDISLQHPLAKAFLEFGEVDCIVNFAAESHVDRSIRNSMPFIESNVKGTVNLLELVKNGLAKKMVQVSTDEVYGSLSVGSWDEESPIAPRSPYSASKASAEMFCDAYRNTHGINVIISRCANNYGARQSVEKFIPTVITSIISERNIGIYGDGENRREWLHVIDHCSALYLLVTALANNHNHYNIGGIELSNNQMATKLIEIASSKKTSISYVTDRTGHDFRYSVDDDRIRQEFGWRPTFTLEKGLLETYNWYLCNESWIETSKERLSL
jgi:dTDP-glucose 4,6-dehydratase